ncbi:MULTISPECIES: IPT/TIG domain-containing protein [Streptomyces]|uniref:Cell surface protein n=2 Tax=Streptomyces TaxID=1883 RepID=A0A3R7EQZ5_9ACTN|nr:MULTISPECIES: IPT/TIG domain-containing protein [Streptomyces]KNE78805.1 cell surface protein [Streptomyces fradiae]OFA34665.1 cell surface protein [Streptomyces fradiae]PQM21578.1 cell surface protein [Streptomyces xinghaiensis]RKM94360.1 cell surface protein [Streptomyces xinghaiensis]RNC71960.1 cell surface protein [Streptomyces xinghaiensis]
MPISPNQGSTGGGTPVTVTGTNLTGTSAVTFGTKPATNVVNVSPTEVTAVAPSGTGTVGVTVTTPGGTSNPAPFFYVGAPFKSTLSPTEGVTAGGNTVTITGTGLSTATSVSFGGVTAVPTVTSDSQLTVTVPVGAGPGPVPVSVTTAGGVNNGFSYTYVDDPTLDSLTPTSGPTTGGTAVTITGTNLTTTEEVTFGVNPAPFSVVNSTTVSAVTPAGAAGAVDVTITNAAGSDTAIGAFTYVAEPGI